MKAVDFFAGLGGFTEGARRAGADVILAANHDPAAVRAHMANHPDAIHVCQDLRQLDMTALPRHDLLLASPACQGHTHARGRERPHHDSARATAWAVVAAAEAGRPRAIVVENVPAFRRWVLYPSWIDALTRLGYATAEHVLDAADFGVPQHRVRLFVVAVRARAPIALTFDRTEHRPFAPAIRWDRWPWSPVAAPGRAAATLARIAAGRRRFGDRFLMPYYGSGSGLTGRALDRPLGTVTTRDRWAIVAGDRMRMVQPPELAAAQAFPAGYVLPETRAAAVFMLGNAVPPPLAQGVIEALKRAA